VWHGASDEGFVAAVSRTSAMHRILVLAAACAIVISAAVLGATTQGPLSAIVLVMELIGRDRSYVVPMTVAEVLATLVSRSIEPRSIYDARLTDEQVRARRAPPKIA